MSASLNPQWEAGREAGFSEGFDRGYDDGFADGLNEGVALAHAVRWLLREPDCPTRLREVRAALTIWDAAGNEGLDADERH